jgi:branched-chain amino acid transport system substrate-binding protein
MLWAEGVRRAKSVKQPDVAKAMADGTSIEGPSGKVAIDGATHHVSLDMHLIEIRQQKLNVLQTFAQRAPRETQAVCDLRKTPDASTQHEIKF